MSVSEPLILCRGAARTYGSGEATTVALRPTDCEVPPGAHIALVGRSGSGKSTLLHLMAGLDDPTTGSVTWPGIGERPSLRPGPIAIVFQGPSLLPPLTVVENVALPLVLDDATDAEARRHAHETLQRLDLDDIATKLPEEISGGQAQRVAVARALAGRPRVILADEPTGQLDRGNATAVIDVLLAAAEHLDAVLVVATHDPVVAARLDERWEMHDGTLSPTSVGGRA